jgi:SPP1 gp7 family putative phage head morphogenesis protein
MAKIPKLRSRNPFDPVRTKRIERQYSGQLKMVAKMVGSIVDNGYRPDDQASINEVTDMLERYAVMLDGWAHKAADKMLTAVGGADYKAWKSLSVEMSKGMAREMESAPTGEIYRRLQHEQVELIKSLPLEAALRVQKLSLEGMLGSKRADVLQQEIMRSGHVAESRAALIARTETARASANFTEARARHAGSTHYVWKTSEDSDVRHDHQILNGKVFAWDDPPIADQRSGTRSHPGCIWSCRCYAAPILPE